MNLFKSPTGTERGRFADNRPELRGNVAGKLERDVVSNITKQFIQGLSRWDFVPRALSCFRTHA